MALSSKKVIVLTSVLLMLGAIVALFWYQELKYMLPTPKPLDYKEIKVGTKVSVTQVNTAGKRAKFLHFFNASCPCSRFNLEHLQKLVQQYGSHVDFYAVIQAKNQADLQKSWLKYNIPIPYIDDIAGKIADSLGVYSTPQAVILTPKNQIYFRGNYNISRYCTAHNTEFARIALDAWMKNQACPKMDPRSSVAYGCELPSNIQDK